MQRKCCIFIFVTHTYTCNILPLPHACTYVHAHMHMHIHTHVQFVLVCFICWSNHVSSDCLYYLVLCLLFQQFLTKALTSCISKPKRFGPPLPYLKPLGVCTSDSATADVIFNTWPGLMFHLSDYLTEGVSEEVGVQHIWLLFSAGLDLDAMEVSGGFVILWFC